MLSYTYEYIYKKDMLWVKNEIIKFAECNEFGFAFEWVTHLVGQRRIMHDMNCSNMTTILLNNIFWKANWIIEYHQSLVVWCSHDFVINRHLSKKKGNQNHHQSIQCRNIWFRKINLRIKRWIILFIWFYENVRTRCSFKITNPLEPF